MTYTVFTDGAVSGNGKANAPGGWAYVVLDENGTLVAQDSGNERGTTNQRMELMACLRACQWVEENDPFGAVNVLSDSAYLVNCWKQNWWKGWENNGWRNSKKEPVANQDLWKQIIKFFYKAGYDFIKVKGHAGNKYNEMVDQMAVAAKEALM